MENLTVDILAYPVLPYTMLFALVLLYWLIAALGLVDIEAFDIETPELDIDGEGVEGFAGLLVRLGLNGVPLTVAITFIAFYGWGLIAIVCLFWGVFINGFLMELLLGTPILLAVTYVAIRLTAVSIRPLRKFFKRVEQYTEKRLIGQPCVIRTSKVTESFGEANFDDGGAGLILKVRAPEEKGFKNGDTVILLEHLEHEDAYRVISEDEFKYGQ